MKNKATSNSEIQSQVVNGFCSFDFIDEQSKENMIPENEVRMQSIDGFKHNYPIPECIRKMNILL